MAALRMRAGTLEFCCSQQGRERVGLDHEGLANSSQVLLISSGASGLINAFGGSLGKSMVTTRA